MSKLTLERLKALVEIDPDNGSIRWKRRSGCKTGIEAGSYNMDGRRQIMIDRKQYMRHRLIWFYVHRTWPKSLDHINRDRSDDKISNLRPATTPQNMWNMGPTRKTSTGVKGVYFIQKSQNYLVQARRFCRRIHLGYFANLKDARAAYASFAVKHDGEFACHGYS